MNKMLKYSLIAFGLVAGLAFLQNPAHSATLITPPICDEAAVASGMHSTNWLVYKTLEAPTDVALFLGVFGPKGNPPMLPTSLVLYENPDLEGVVRVLVRTTINIENGDQCLFAFFDVPKNKIEDYFRGT